MAYTKEVSVDTEVEVDIEFDDLISYIESEGLSNKEIDALTKVVRQCAVSDGSTNLFGYYTIMDEIAANELNDLIKLHGAESILAMVKAGQEVRV